MLPAAVRPARRATALLVAPVLAVGALTGCTPDRPRPDDVVAALAAGLEARDLADVPVVTAVPEEVPDDATLAKRAAGATAQVVAAVEGMGEQPHTVRVGDVEVTERDGTTTATAELTHRWDLEHHDEDWSYTTTATLTLVEDRWLVPWSLGVLAPDITAGETLTTVRTSSERAPVLDGDGTAIVEPRPVLRLGIDKTHVEAARQERSARAVAELLDLDPAEYAARVAGAGEKAFVEALVVREQDPGVDVDAVLEVEGASALPDELPLAPTRRFARPILGTAGPATAEVVEESEGAVVAGDLVGLSGLQRQYDAQLRGSAGVEVVARRADGDDRSLFALEPVAGTPLRTTLDADLQDLAETVLEDVEPASGLVAIRPSTGAVLAAASGPGGEGHSTATLGTFAPGSVFKLATALAMLRSGMDAGSSVQCPTTTTVEGRAFRNFPDYPSSAMGTVPLSTAFAHSCNTAFIGAREAVDPAALVDAAASLGLGGEPDLGFPASLGSVPADMTGTDHAASMIGQGRVQASPLAMAAVAASVAAGRTVTPWLVGETAPAVDAPATPLTADEAATLRELMRGVVTEGGGGLLADVPGEQVLAKTGTAEVGEGDERHNHTWMVAVQGDLAVAVLVERGEYGSTTAGPLLERFLRGAR